MCVCVTYFGENQKPFSIYFWILLYSNDDNWYVQIRRRIILKFSDISKQNKYPTLVHNAKWKIKCK